MITHNDTSPVLHRVVKVPSEFRLTETVDGTNVTYGGDVRMGDLRNTGSADFLVYRSVGDAHDGGGMKPCFLGAFDIDGTPLWRQGDGGTQPTRPGPVAIHDIDGDGRTEVVCLFHDPSIEAAPTSMANVCIQIRDGETGEIKGQAAPEGLRACEGEGPNWAHQRIMIANFRGRSTPQDFVIKLGEHILAFDSSLDLLWEYVCPWTDYGHCPSYIVAVGDIDGDGRDEVNGGYFLLDHDGSALWENDIAPHMDSVAVDLWDKGRMRAICSGYGHVVDASGEVVLALGEAHVPHGQEVRVGCFSGERRDPHMVIRHNGHCASALVVDTSGRVVNELEMNATLNNTGMEVVRWNGVDGPDLLYNGGMLWDPLSGGGVTLPDLPLPEAVGRMAWYHCIPANVCGDAREELVLYNPWDTGIYIFTQNNNAPVAAPDLKFGPRQYNARLMD
jgi:hypothetical protein